ncbi:fimbrial protein [Vagococcus sp. WN89Y]|uniref:fimbrial protein n=1 Tax=Vagococcus sp. WN89Y TaxID=3457258 RepID=UPI003FCCDACA
MKRYIAVWLSALFGLSTPLVTEAVQVNFNGELVNLPCQLAPESTKLEVLFLDRPVKDFQSAPARSPEQDFRVRLVECDVNSVQKTVKLKFTGEKETAMTGQADYFLKVSGVNRGKLAIGLLDTTGQPMKLGEAHNNNQGTSITGNIMTFDFKAFVQATPEAIAHRAVQPGEYQAIAEIELAYE